MPSNDAFLTLDVSDVLSAFKELEDQLRSKLETAVKSLAIQAEAHIREQANSKLHSRREAFLEELSWEQLDKGVFAVIIGEKARWIEDGVPPHNMIEDLLSSKSAKTSKSGSRYVVIPFKHSIGKTRSTAKQKVMVAALRSALRAKGIPYKKIERNADGTPKTGLLHSFNLAKPESQHRVGPPFVGPQGQHFQAHPAPGGREGPGGRPYLQGVRIYQSELKTEAGKVEHDEEGNPKVERNIFTFRTVSSKQKGSGAWEHPGLHPMGFIEETKNWAEQEWDSVIQPEILASLGLR